jgi:hypothetical protein
MTTTKTLDRAALAQFTGTEKWYRHPLVRRVLYTEGVQYVAEHAGAYWLLDEIAFGQSQPTIAAEEFQVWKLAVAGNTAMLRVEDGNNNTVFEKAIEYTDFPEPGIDLWYADNVILLPSEY